MLKQDINEFCRTMNPHLIFNMVIMKNHRTTVGERIADERSEKGLNQSELAEKIDVTQRTLSNYERDKTSPDNQFWQNTASLGLDIQFILLGVRTNPEKLREILAVHSNGGLTREQIIETIQYLSRTMYELSKKLE